MLCKLDETSDSQEFYYHQLNFDFKNNFGLCPRYGFILTSMSKMGAHIEWFSVECRKSKTKVITLANQNTNNTVNQSKLEVITGT